MIRRVAYLLLMCILLTSCGGAAATPAPSESEAPATESAAITQTSEFPVIIETASPEPLPTATQTPAPTQTPAATQTETSLPPLELPTEIRNAPPKMVWDGTPT